MRTNNRERDAEVYLEAAREHLLAVGKLLESPENFALAYYAAGLSVECVFRAYTELNGGQHDSKHDLRRHAEASRFFECIPEHQKEGARVALLDVLTRWRNNHRFNSENGLRKYLNDEGLYRLTGNKTVRGDVVRYNVEPIYNGALLIVTLGVARWESSRKKWNRS